MEATKPRIEPVCFNVPIAKKAELIALAVKYTNCTNDRRWRRCERGHLIAGFYATPQDSHLAVSIRFTESDTNQADICTLDLATGEVQTFGKLRAVDFDAMLREFVALSES